MRFTQWFDNIKLTTKMMTLGIVVLVGIAIPSYFFVQLSVDKQLTAEMEIKGILPATNAVKLKKILGEHAGIAVRKISGDKTLGNALNEKGNEINRHLIALKQLVQKTNDSQDLVSFIEVIQTEFRELQTSINSKAIVPAKSFTLHTAIIIKSATLISKILKTYLLSYDPQEASYHLIVANFIDLPRLANSLGKVRSAGASALEQGYISNEQIALIRGFVNTIEAPNRDFDYNMFSAAEADVRLLQLNNQGHRVRTAIDDLNRLVENKVFSSNELSFPASEYANEFTKRINDLYSVHDKSLGYLTLILQERIDAAKSERNISLISVSLLLLIALGVGLLIHRSIVHSVRKLIDAFARIARNEYDFKLDRHRKDEMGILERELFSLTIKLQDAAEIALEASKVKQALESSSACFMMSNAEREIVYMNKAVYDLLKRSESQIRKDLPQFNVETLIGSSIDIFNKISVNQAAIVTKLTNVHEDNLELGELSFRLMVCPIIDEHGNALGNSIEWHDMSKILEEERRVTRILKALDSTSTNVMIANADGEIIYMNRSVQSMLKECERDLREELPHFAADNVMGANIDIFYRNPEQQRVFLTTLQTKHESQMTLGPCQFRLTVNPVLDANQVRIGTVVEWLDRTKEAIAEREIASIVDASLAGDFTKRIDETGKQDFLLVLAKGLNELMQTTENGLNDVSSLLLSLSEGDLTKHVTREHKGTFNELKLYCNRTTNNLADIINKIREASDTINLASTEIASGNADLSVRTEQQASSLEETASSIEELTITVRQNSENANKANQLSTQATEVAENGGNLVQQVISTMSSINDSAQKISDIIGVIDSIAFQTNILALNAAVEAARAGEQGRGFAVVASEVRSLAQRSAKAAKDIKDLISDSVSKVATGNHLVNQSGQTMQEIVASIKSVNILMSEIATASAEQSSGIDEVSKAVVQMDEMTQQNAALVEESAAAAQSMTHQTSDLISHVASFKLKAETMVSKTHGGIKQHQPSMVDCLPSASNYPTDVSDNLSFVGAKRVSNEEEWESF